MLPLEVYDWINNRPERFRVSESDAAIQLDLIAKVRGFSSAEVFFLSLEDQLKNKRTYGALLNVYVHSRLKEKAESLFDTMRSKGYVVHALPFNVMMTLYMNVKEYVKVDMLVSEMMEKKIQLDIYTYNIWLSSSGSQGSIEKMEQVFEQMEKDATIIPNWSTFSTMASMYIRMDQTEKAEECLRKVESRIKGRDRIPFHYLLSLYGRVRNKDEVYRVWNSYKTVFPKNTPNLGYHAIIASLVKLDDIAGAEKLYQEWVSVKSSYDPRVGNLLLGWYVEAGDIHKALSFFKQMKEDGGFPNSNTWEILSEGYIADKRISEALSCLKDAFMVADNSRSWRPKPLNLSAFLELCQEQGDMESAETFIVLLKLSKFSKHKTYASLIGSSGDGLSSKIDTIGRNDDIHDREDMDGESEMLLNELESSF
ncbi:pentatricopeptide repeat-containing protein At1g02150 isoform X2 [Phaseolus vulgaris]|uniref:pentatricopeptide repeat-containing protein At1g02150 isoform X2 n=1 Tax=Phaseolus vulgaris TaxID=3885 RepID=UPI0035CAE4B4